MKFDYTHGKTAKYMVSVHGWNVNDQYYYGDYKSAKEMFSRMVDRRLDGVSVSLWDMVKDIRKEFAKA
jgi:NifB/MoaA-like Fe-S oxidoreductase